MSVRAFDALTMISIHAPRVGSDPDDQFDLYTGCISIHAPRVGSDRVGLFTSHLPLYFNPRSPCGERQPKADPAPVATPISIHAPRVGSDRKEAWNNFISTRNFNPRSPCGERPAIQKEAERWKVFQSTLPVWGATIYDILGNVFSHISIHAPRVGSDQNR